MALFHCEFCVYVNYYCIIILRGGVMSQFNVTLCNVTFRSNLYFTSVYLIASCYRAIMGIF